MERTKFIGVYFRKSEGKRYNGRKPDACFYIAYRKEGRLLWEKTGWASEGYSPKLATRSGRAVADDPSRSGVAQGKGEGPLLF